MILSPDEKSFSGYCDLQTLANACRSFVSNPSDCQSWGNIQGQKMRRQKNVRWQKQEKPL